MGAPAGLHTVGALQWAARSAPTASCERGGFLPALLPAQVGSGLLGSRACALTRSLGRVGGCNLTEGETSKIQGPVHEEQSSETVKRLTAKKLFLCGFRDTPSNVLAHRYVALMSGCQGCALLRHAPVWGVGSGGP